jgi:hypothetical protein
MYHFTADRYTVYHAVRTVNSRGKPCEDAYPKAHGIDHATGEDIIRDFAEQQVTGRLIFLLREFTPP